MIRQALSSLHRTVMQNMNNQLNRAELSDRPIRLDLHLVRYPRYRHDLAGNMEVCENAGERQFN